MEFGRISWWFSCMLGLLLRVSHVAAEIHIAATWCRVSSSLSPTCLHMHGLHARMVILFVKALQHWSFWDQQFWSCYNGETPWASTNFPKAADTHPPTHYMHYADESQQKKLQRCGPVEEKCPLFHDYAWRTTNSWKFLLQPPNHGVTISLCIGARMCAIDIETGLCALAFQHHGFWWDFMVI